MMSPDSMSFKDVTLRRYMEDWYRRQFESQMSDRRFYRRSDETSCRCDGGDPGDEDDGLAKSGRYEVHVPALNEYGIRTFVDANLKPNEIHIVQDGVVTHKVIL